MKNIIITYVPPNRMHSNFASIYICSMYSHKCITLSYGNIDTPTLLSREFKLKKKLMNNNIQLMHFKTKSPIISLCIKKTYSME